MVQIVKVWADDVPMKMAGWKGISVDTTIGRIMKLITQGDIVELTGIIHRFRGQVWKRSVRSGHRLKSALSDRWIDVDSTVYGVYEEACTSNLSGRQWLFLWRVAGLPGVSIGGIPYQGKVEESDRVAQRPEMGVSGGKRRLGTSRFYASMCHMESCKTICGGKDVDQNREEIV